MLNHTDFSASISGLDSGTKIQIQEPFKTNYTLEAEKVNKYAETMLIQNAISST